jgi:hypothetical protein
VQTAGGLFWLTWLLLAVSDVWSLPVSLGPVGRFLALGLGKRRAAAMCLQRAGTAALPLRCERLACMLRGPSVVTDKSAGAVASAAAADAS